MPEESRDASGKPVFHYNREERMASLPESIRNRGDRKQPFFKRNRSLAITLLDVGILLVIFLLVYPMVQRRDNTREWGPYSFTLRAIAVEESTLLSLKSELRGALDTDAYPELAQSPAVFQGRYHFDLAPDTPQVSGVLDTREDAVQFFRLEVDKLDLREKIYLTLELPDATLYLQTRLE